MNHLVYRGWISAAAVGVVSGAIAATGMPPMHSVGSAIMGFALLTLWVAYAPSSWRWLTILGILLFCAAYEVTVQHWVYRAILASPREMHFLIPFSYLTVAITGWYLMILAATVFGLRPVRFAPPWVRALTLIVVFLLGTWLRYVPSIATHPWITPGYFFPPGGAISQWASVVGVPGLDALVLMLALGVVFTLMLWQQFSHHRRQRIIPLAAILTWTLGVFVAVWIYGSGRLADSAALEVPTEPNGTGRSAPSFDFRIVQANVEQRLSMDFETVKHLYAEEIRLSREPTLDGRAPPRVIIWPESAIPLVIKLDNPVLKDMAQAVLTPGRYIMFGTLLLGDDSTRPANSTILVNSDGQPVSVYNKKRLMIFGEFVPFEDVVPVVKMLQLNIGSLARGTGLWTPDLPQDIPANKGLICIEVAFPLDIGDTTHQRWINNTTNDGWFGDSYAPLQHYAISRYRGIEHGLPLVRTAITGVSGVVDAFGRELERIELGTTGFVDSQLPPALQPTLWLRWGIWASIIFAVVILAGMALIARLSFSSQTKQA